MDKSNNAVSFEKINGSKLSRGTKIGYGVASIGEQLAYNIFYIFFLVFLTDVAGLSPSIAGMISLLAVVWDGFTDPMIGYLSDNSKNPKGRRNPFILYAAVPLGLTIFLLFNKVDFGGTGTVLYYLCLNMLFWFFLTMADIPYISLGAELTNDFEERTTLRTYATIFFYIGVVVAGSGTLILVDMFFASTGDIAQAWRGAIGVLAAIVTITYLITWYLMRGKEHPNTDEALEEHNMDGFFKRYKDTFKIKSNIYLALTTLVFIIAFTFSTSNMVYWMGVYGQFSYELISLVILLYGLLTLAFIPLVGSISHRIGKKNMFISGVLVYGIGILLFKMVNINDNQSLVYIHFIVMALGGATFWTLIYSMAYDVSEVEELRSGKRCEGIIIAVLSFFIKVGTALAMWWIGVVLEKSGYNPELMEQSAETLNGIVNLQTVYPGIFVILSVVIIAKYPLSKNKFEAVKIAIEKKKNGEKYSIEEFEDVM